MRLVLANPHVHHYGKVVSKTLARLQNQMKYSYFIEHFIRNKNRPTAFFIDGTRSSFNELGVRFRFFPQFFATLELLIWMLINRINPFKHKIYFDVKKLNPREDIIFNFSFTTLDSFSRNNDELQFHKYSGLVVIQLTHYLSEPAKLNAYLKQIEHCFLVAENDLSKNPYFHRYFPDIKQVYHLPFYCADRFKKRTDFKNRKNKCIGLGTFSTPKSKDFCDFFGKGTNLQPMRKLIDLRKEEFKDCLDSLMYNFDNERSLKEIHPEDPFHIRLVKKFLPYFMLYKILPSRQSKYLAFDIVQKHNEYRMFVAPEEIIGLPSNNVFEGMACGTVFLGADDPMYTNLGMESGLHYVAYKKNSVLDLIEKIRFFQKHPRELERISKNGQNFSEKLRANKVADFFWKDLEKLLASFNAGKPQFICSFLKR